MTGSMLFGAIDLEKPAESALTTQNTFMVWAQVELPGSSNRSSDGSREGPGDGSSDGSSEEGDWARFDMPIHMRYLPAGDGAAYTPVAVPPPMVAVRCDGEAM